jgi:hypothetical protein
MIGRERHRARWREAFAIPVSDIRKMERAWRTLFFRPEGPMIQYRRGSLLISDLNPEASMRWAISRAELFRVGLRFLFAAIRG